MSESVSLPSSVESLPPDVLSDASGPLSDADCCCSDDDDVSLPGNVSDHEEADLVPHVVPSPDMARGLSLTRHDVAEFYSPPRVLLRAQAEGLTGCLSLDLKTGWDFRCASSRSLSLDLLSRLPVTLCILSPPCTVFSQWQRICVLRTSQAAWQAKWEEGMLYLCHAMECARRQTREGRFFVFEHPATATSWEQTVVKDIASLPGVQTVTCDLCMLGLQAKVSKLPMRKPTKIMTNSSDMARRFVASGRCDKSHSHQAIEGAEGGVRRSVWAQVYPEAMIDLLVAGAASLE